MDSQGCYVFRNPITPQSWVRIRFPQLNQGHQTLFDPWVIRTGRRLKTSACSRFWPLFSRCFAKLSPLQFSRFRCRSADRRESFGETFRPFSPQLSALSKSLGIGVIVKLRPPDRFDFASCPSGSHGQRSTHPDAPISSARSLSSSKFWIGI